MSMEFPEPYTGDGGGSDFEPLPKGEYVAQAVEGRIAPPKTGNGMALTLVWKILEGDYEGRQIWQNISFIHPKAGAQWHGQRKLNAVIAAVAATLPLATVEPLLFVPVRLGLDIEEDDTGRYEPKNVVTRITRLDGEAEEAAQAAPPRMGPTAPKAAVATGKSPPPWHRQ
jgi:hypothetical protein